jgi:hypothetical protein
MEELLWAIVAIGFIAVSTDVVEWLANKIEDRFK